MQRYSHSLVVILLLLGICSPPAQGKYKRNSGGSFPPKPSMPSMPDPKSMPSPKDAAKGAVGMMKGPTISKPQFSVNGTVLVDKVMEAVRAELNKQGLAVVIPPDIEFEERGCKVGLYEGKIIGLTNFQRVGDVITVTEPLSTKFRSAFGFTDVSYDTGVEIACGNTTFDNGRMKMTSDNATVLQVYKLNHVDQMITLDTFETSLGLVKNDVSGLGNDTEKVNAISNKAIEKGKPPLLMMFNISFKIAVNIAIQAVRASLMAG